MNYDFEIVVPVDPNQHYIKKRIEDFKKYGLLNRKDLNIHLTLLANKEDNFNTWLESEWPEGIQVETINCPKNHVAQKIYHYYERHIKSDFAKWYIRIDEDSITDLDGLGKSLELHFDYTRPYHITGRLLYDTYPLDQKILTTLGFGGWYRNSSIQHIYEGPAHEQEISVTSVTAINMMLQNPTAKKYFQLRKEFAEGYGDHGLCHTLRMCKVYGTEMRFLCNDPNLCQHSIFGGNKNHVHWVARDQNPKYMEWMENNTGKTDDRICDKTFMLGDEQKHLVKFYRDNKIKLVCENIKDEDNHNTIGLWCVEDDSIIIIFDFYQKLIRFKFDNMNFENVSMIEI